MVRMTIDRKSNQVRERARGLARPSPGLGRPRPAWGRRQAWAGAASEGHAPCLESKHPARLRITFNYRPWAWRAAKRTLCCVCLCLCRYFSLPLHQVLFFRDRKFVGAIDIKDVPSTASVVVRPMAS